MWQGRVGWPCEREPAEWVIPDAGVGCIRQHIGMHWWQYTRAAGGSGRWVGRRCRSNSLLEAACGLKRLASQVCFVIVVRGGGGGGGGGPARVGRISECAG